MKIHLKTKDIKDLTCAITFEDLLEIAFRILKKAPKPICMVCGPITSGGGGSVEENLKMLKNVIEKLAGVEMTVFDQTIFEESLWRITATPYCKGKDHLLEAFYLPILESGFLKKVYFLPDWRTSYGATWEHTQALKFGIEIVYLQILRE